MKIIHFVQHSLMLIPSFMNETDINQKIKKDVTVMSNYILSTLAASSSMLKNLKQNETQSARAQFKCSLVC